MILTKYSLVHEFLLFENCHSFQTLYVDVSLILIVSHSPSMSYSAYYLSNFFDKFQQETNGIKGAIINYFQVCEDLASRREW